MMKRRRHEYKTDYRARIEILKSAKPRVVFRKTNRYVLGQFVESIASQDRILAQATSRELLSLGWPKEYSGSLKSLPASYLTGFLLGKRVIEKHGEHEALLDTGLLHTIPKSRMFAFAQGVVDAGLSLKVKKEVIPNQERLGGGHMKKDIASIINKIKEKIHHG